MKKHFKAIILFLRLWGTLGYGREMGKHTFYEWIYESRLGIKTSWNVASGIWLNKWNKQDLSKYQD